jgi:hypothetical protein
VEILSIIQLPAQSTIKTTTMNVLVIIVLIILGIAALVLITALFVKKEYVVKREIAINKPNSEVFNYVRFQKNQDHYNKWVMADPNARKSFSGTDGTVGFIYAWDSDNKKVGKGEQEIKKIREGEKVDLEVRFIKPFEGVGLVYMTTDPLPGNGTRLQWGMQGRNKYPFNLMNLFIGGMLGKDLESSLLNLKAILEQ